MAATVIMLGYGESETCTSSKVVKAHIEGCSTDGSMDKLKWGGCSLQGWSDCMEDKYSVCIDNKYLILGVYDGHRGSRASNFCARRMHVELMQAKVSTCLWTSGLAEAFMRMDELLLEKTRGDESLKCEGTTALVVVIGDGKLVVANAGDCRCVIYRHGKALELSRDHRCGDVGSSEWERSRVEQAGGYVKDGRVYTNGCGMDSTGLGVSRAIGDFDYKMNPRLPLDMQVVVALPEVVETEIEEGDEFVVLASDGIWGSRSSKEVVEFVANKLKDGALILSNVCRELSESCLVCDGKHPSSRDNMTVIIAQLK